MGKKLPSQLRFDVGRCAVGRDLPTPGQHGAAEDGEAKDNQRPSHLTEPRSILEGQYD